jgi:uncharacterized membrane protein HdeD (DUF308 family)
MKTAFQALVWILNTVLIAIALLCAVMGPFLMIMFWLILTAIVAVAAETRGRFGGGWFLLSCVITPLLAGLLLLALPNRKPVTPVTVKVVA